MLTSHIKKTILLDAMRHVRPSYASDRHPSKSSSQVGGRCVHSNVRSEALTVNLSGYVWYVCVNGVKFMRLPSWFTMGALDRMARNWQAYEGGR